jgi:hypothetical protein
MQYRKIGATALSSSASSSFPAAPPAMPKTPSSVFNSFLDGGNTTSVATKQQMRYMASIPLQASSSFNYNKTVGGTSSAPATNDENNNSLL